MNQLEKIRPIIEKQFKSHPKFYRIYKERKDINKINLNFSDMLICISAVGWDIYFVEIHNKLPNYKRQLLYAKVCKNKEELMEMLIDARETFVKPPPPEPMEETKLKVNIKHLIKERIKAHPKFENILEGYKKLFVIFKDILIIVEDIGGTFYNWELFKREGKIMVIHKNAGAKVGFDRIVDQVVELREECDNKPLTS